MLSYFKSRSIKRILRFNYSFDFDFIENITVLHSFKVFILKFLFNPIFKKLIQHDFFLLNFLK